MWNSKIYLLDSNPTNILVAEDMSKLAVIDAKDTISQKTKLHAYRDGLNEILRWIVHEWYGYVNGDALLHKYAKYKMLNFIEEWKIEIKAKQCS